MMPKASPAFAPPDMPPEVGSAVGVALVPEAASTPGVETTGDVTGAVGEDVTFRTELSVGCESDGELCDAGELGVSACSVAVGTEDSVGCGSWAAGPDGVGATGAGGATAGPAWVM